MNDGNYLTVATESVAAEKITTEPESGKYAYYKDSVLTLNNYTYVGEGYLNNSSDYNNSYALIFSEKELGIIL